MIQRSLEVGFESPGRAGEGDGMIEAPNYEVYAVRYATREARRGEHFLMIDHGVGVALEEAYEIKPVDFDYFDEV
jgi:restriction endonuclease Mrr